MSAINSITESWNNHTFQEVETHIKGSYLPLTSVSVDSISSGVANVLTLNSSNAVKKTSLSDLASLLGVYLSQLEQVDNITNMDDLKAPTSSFRCVFYVGDKTTTSNYPPIGTNDIRAFVFLFNWADGYNFQLFMSPNDRENRTWIRSYNYLGWSTWKEL